MSEEEIIREYLARFNVIRLIGGTPLDQLGLYLLPVRTKFRFRIRPVNGEFINREKEDE